jgi:serine phosphatase RsbU (regulator of sigma subunit)
MLILACQSYGQGDGSGGGKAKMQNKQVPSKIENTQSPDTGTNKGKRSRQQKLDSLIRISSIAIQETRDDSVLFYSYTERAQAYHNQDNVDSATHDYTMAIKISEEAGNESWKAKAYNNIGLTEKNKGDFIMALSYYRKSIESCRLSKNIGLESNVLNNMAKIYTSLGQHNKAIQVVNSALKIAETVKDPLGIAISMKIIGTIYMEQGEYREAIKVLKKCAMTIENASYNVGLAGVYDILGETYLAMNYVDSALVYYQKGLKMRETEISKRRGIAKALKNVASVYLKNEDFELSEEHYMRSFKLSKQINDLNGQASSMLGVGIINYKLNRIPVATTALNNSLDMAQSIGNLKVTRDASKILWEIHKNLLNHHKALDMYELFVSSNDRLNSDENQKEVIRQQYKYEYEKQAAEDSIKTAEADKVKDAQLLAEKAENKRHELEAKQQKEQKMYLYGGLGLALLFGGFIFNRFRVTSKQKGIIEEQKIKVDEAFDELEEKNTEILDSINYAKRIQSAILPPTKLVKEYLSSSFILYKPKDIVAGDFYWLEPTKEGVLFAAADCTGHGVPGAMVSVVCNNGLNRSVREYGLRDPGAILSKTREIVISEFEKSEEDVKDGMDIALCSINGNKLKYAGAHNSLWIIRNGATEIEEFKADKQPIGKYDEPKPYTTHTIDLNGGDSFYIFSDGYADQFGGEKGKKYKTANFKRLLLSIQNVSIEQQRQLIDEAFEAWKGQLEQLDDVCVIGVRI